jgi:hypothetical protein
MVEKTDLQDSALDFFDDVFLTVAPAFRQVSQEYLDADADKQQSKKQKKKNKGDANAGLSLVEINERAQAKVEEFRRVNREKSLKKIAELTKMHKLAKQQKE